MERILLKEISARPSAYDGERVTVAGWARTIRDSKAFGFIELNDGSCFKNTQVVFERAALSNYDEIAHQNVGAGARRDGAGGAHAREQAAVRDQGGKNRRGGRIRARLSAAEEAAHGGVPARHRASAPPHQSLFRRVPPFGARRRSPFINFSTTAASSTCIPPSSRAATAKARAACSR